VKPYADAPRLPEGDRIAIGDVFPVLGRGAFFEIELGPGRGVFIQERAMAEPSAVILGLEIRRKWASIVDGRLAKAGLAARARVLAEDARVALPRLGPDASVRRVFSHFPDPWWKKRHEKRVVLAAPVVNEIARLLERGGELFVQTDVEHRATQLEALLASDARFRPSGDNAGARLAENPYGARSPREKRAIADGLPIYRVRFTRT